MKKSAVFLALSLAANATLVTVYLVRPIPADRPTADANFSANDRRAAGPGAIPLSVLASDDLARLQSAGVPEDIARSLVIGRANEKLRARLRALRAQSPGSTRWWTISGALGGPSQTKEQRAEARRAQRDYADAIRAATGEDPNGFTDPRNSFLPAAKREQLRRITDDYGEMQGNVYGEMAGIQLPTDVAKLRLLRQEQDRDIAALLTPDEMAEYQLRVSPTAANLNNRFGDAIQSEEDYRKIFDLQKAFDDQYSFPDGPATQASMQKRVDAERQLMDDIHAAIGDEHFAAIQHSLDPDRRLLTSLATRLNLSGDTVDTVLAARDAAAAQSQQINQDASLSPQERNAQLKSLAGQVQTELQASLGSDAANAYAQRVSWVNLLKSGTAFTTNPKDAPKGFNTLNNSAFPVPPPHPAPR